MRLLALGQTFASRDDIVFKNKPLGPAIMTVVFTSLLAWDIYGVVHVRTHGIPARPDNGLRFMLIFVGLFLLGFAYHAQHAWRAALRPSNWLMRIRDNRVMIKFRNFENWRLSDADLQIIELDRQEIAFVRRAVVRVVDVQLNGRTQERTQTMLELSLQNVDLAVIDAALSAERSKRVEGGDTLLNYPVELKDNVLHIKWEWVSPGLKRALVELEKLVPVKEETKTVNNFTPAALKTLSEEERRKRIQELAVKDSLAAIRTVREFYGCSLAEAKEIVEKVTVKSER